jgi:hypothetical protein
MRYDLDDDDLREAAFYAKLERARERRLVALSCMSINDPRYDSEEHETLLQLCMSDKAWRG